MSDLKDKSCDKKSPTTFNEVAEHPNYVMDAIEKLNLPHPDYEG